MMPQFTQSRVFDGAKLESEHCFPCHDFVPFYRHLEKKIDWGVVSVIIYIYMVKKGMLERMLPRD